LAAAPVYDGKGSFALSSIIAGGTVPATNTLTIDGHLAALPADAVDAIKTGKIAYYIYGFIRYDDDFSLFGSRQTGYCFVYNPDGNNNSRFNVCRERSYTYAR
jgi:hypothetical protein